MHQEELIQRSRPVFPLKNDPVQSGPDVSHLVINARKLIACDERQLAKALLAESLRMRPNHYQSLKLLSSIFSENENGHKTHVLEFLYKKNKDREVLKLLGDHYYILGEDKKALDIYFEILELINTSESDLFQIYKNIGNIFVREHDFDGAEEYYNKAQCLNPQSDVLMVNLGTLAIQKNDLDEAQFRFRQAIECQSKNDKAWVGLSMVNNEKGDFELARENIRRAIEINPRNKTAVQIFANWCVRDSRAYEVEIYLQSFLDHEDFDEEISLLLVQVFTLNSKFGLASLELERFLIWNPTHIEALALESQLNAIQE